MDVHKCIFKLAAGIDRARVHPKFLHSNATSHKWALGAFAELLDNAMDEVNNGASYVYIDVLENKKDGNKMLLVQDNGGGMDPDKMRQCMSLGYSAKSKMANTIGQYGNGFKTSTMRLGADVIVFSLSHGKDGRKTQAIGMLSYTFLRRTGKEEIVVPMIDYENRGKNWEKIIRSSLVDLEKNLETIVQWSPYESEYDLFQQFNYLDDQGTRIIIYNLWEDDQGALELDFETDEHDIQIRGVNRDEKKIEMAKKYPNSKHFLTYRHSLRSYASILYLKLPSEFRIILRGKDVDHHNIVTDMMHIQEITYKPIPIASDSEQSKNSNITAAVTVGFVKDAKDHIDVQGFNVYHKNRLIKAFWRLWNAAGSDGRGVIGVLEANFVEPAHDKQGFERTTALSRLEARLIAMQKNYWTKYCPLIGYAPRRRQRNHSISPERETKQLHKRKASTYPNESGNHIGDGKSKVISARSNDGLRPVKQEYASNQNTYPIAVPSEGKELRCTAVKHNSEVDAKLKEENHVLRESLKTKMIELQYERDRSASLENELYKVQEQLKENDKEHEVLMNIFTEKRSRRDFEEDKLRKSLKDASETIQELLKKVKLLENRTAISCKQEQREF